MKTVRLNKVRDYETFKSLFDDKEYFESDNIIWERSVKCVADNGDLLGVALIKPNSLTDFFEGKLPSDTTLTKERNSRIKRLIQKYPNLQYEVLFYVNKIGDSYLTSDNVGDSDVQYELSTMLEVDDNRSSIDQILWSNKNLPPMVGGYKPFNNIFINILL